MCPPVFFVFDTTGRPFPTRRGELRSPAGFDVALQNAHGTVCKHTILISLHYADVLFSLIRYISIVLQYSIDFFFVFFKCNIICDFRAFVAVCVLLFCVCYCFFIIVNSINCFFVFPFREVPVLSRHGHSFCRVVYIRAINKIVCCVHRSKPLFLPF